MWRLALETDLKIEREWRGTLQQSLDKEKTKVAKLQADIQHLEETKKVTCWRIYSRHTHTHPSNCPLSGTTRVSRYQKGKTNLDFAEARDSEWQWHQLGKSAPSSRQITTPAPHHSGFYRPDALPAAQPTASKHSHHIANLSFSALPAWYVEYGLWNGMVSIWVSRYQKGKTNLDFTEARDSEWQWHQLGHMQICT